MHISVPCTSMDERRGLPVPDCAKTQVPAQARWMATSHIHKSTYEAGRASHMCHAQRIAARLQRHYVSFFPSMPNYVSPAGTKRHRRTSAHAAQCIFLRSIYFSLKDRLLQAWPRNWPRRSCWDARSPGPALLRLASRTRVGEGLPKMNHWTYCKAAARKLQAPAG